VSTDRKAQKALTTALFPTKSVFTAVCLRLFVNKIIIKLRAVFNAICGIGRLWTRGESIKFWQIGFWFSVRSN